MKGWNHWSLFRIPMERPNLRRPIVAIPFFLFALGAAPQTPAADSQDGTAPYLVKSQFELPLNVEEIKERWSELGYRQCQFEGKEEGWTSDRPERHEGEHTHPWFALFAGKAGKMEFIIQGQRFVLEPGDELHVGRSEWYACWKYY
jgi:hypothetical protein